MRVKEGRFAEYPLARENWRTKLVSWLFWTKKRIQGVALGYSLPPYPPRLGISIVDLRTGTIIASTAITPVEAMIFVDAIQDILARMAVAHEEST